MTSVPSVPTPLHALWRSARAKDLPVCHSGQRLVVWGEFAAHCVGLVERLRPRHETCFLLAAEDPLLFVSGLLALLYAGKQVVVPANTLPATLAGLADVVDARLVDSDLPWGALPLPEGDYPQAIDPDTAIIDLYTSGSSGGPKRVRKTLAQFEAEIAVLESLWGGLIGSAAIVATVPHQHIYGLLFRLFWPLASGRVFDTRTCALPNVLEQRLVFFGRAALVSSPAQLARLPELLPLGALEPKPIAVFSSGGPLSATAARALREALGQAPLEIFGSTETGGVAWRQQNDERGDPWTPFPGHRVSRSDGGALTLVSPFLASTAPLLMDDGIDLLADGRFRLKGRLDRVVKIEEKRLSLPEMEACLGTHAWVDAAAVVALAGRRQSIGAVLVLNAQGRARLATDGRRSVGQTLRQHLTDRYEPVLLPRYWRFPDSLPINARGKLTDAALAELFPEHDEACLLPRVCSVVVESDGRLCRTLLDLHILPQIAHFSGHFPGAALLPGVVQLDWAVHFARQYLSLSGEFSALENVKFLGVVLPDSRIQLSLAWDAERRSLTFSYASAARKYATGRIIFGGVR